MAKFYHFTSMETLYKMLTKSIVVDENTKQRYIEFWATGINALNDTSERDLFVNALTKEVRQYASKIGSILTDEQEKELRKLCYSALYVISLTSSSLSISDELCMWRGYAGNGTGVCLELDFSRILPFYPNQKTGGYQMEDVYILQRCEYVNPDEITIEQDLVKQIYDMLLISEQETLEITVRKAGIIAKIAKLAPFYKHKAYESENEWRFVINSNKEPSYRKRGNLIIPYVTYRIPVSAISSIKIGPCIKDTDETNNLEKFIYNKLGADVEIKYSDIPYRG